MLNKKEVHYRSNKFRYLLYSDLTETIAHKSGRLKFRLWLKLIYCQLYNISVNRNTQFETWNNKLFASTISALSMSLQVSTSTIQYYIVVIVWSNLIWFQFSNHSITAELKHVSALNLLKQLYFGSISHTTCVTQWRSTEVCCQNSWDNMMMIFETVMTDLGSFYCNDIYIHCYLMVERLYDTPKTQASLTYREIETGHER